MKKTYKIGVIAFSIILMVGLCAVVIAATAAPGSESDPVVTKSYVDEKLAGAGGSYAPIEVKKGKKIIGGEGAEIILRSGEATAIATGANGVSDLTAGKDLTGGTLIPLNHLLLVPRNDGRGLLMKADSWVMVRGTYTVQ